MGRPNLSPRERIIVALDVPDLAALGPYLDKLEGRPAFYKVGLELFVAAGARAVEAVRSRGGRVFLDLKLHDIPETVARAVTSARSLGVELFTVHTAGGGDMMKRATLAAEQKMTILGVTVLTSLGAEDLAADGIAGSVADVVERRAWLAADAGVHGLVCSPQEVARLRAALPDVTLVVPGIRSAGAALGDQKRVGAAADTLRAGADYLVVGRPIRDAAQPARAFDALVAQVQDA